MKTYKKAWFLLVYLYTLNFFLLSVILISLKYTYKYLWVNLLIFVFWVGWTKIIGKNKNLRFSFRIDSLHERLMTVNVNQMKCLSNTTVYK